MPDSLLALESVLVRRWTLQTAWVGSGGRLVAHARDQETGDAVTVTAVCCAADGMVTAGLAREIGVMECLAHQPAMLPLLATGRAAGWLYMVCPHLAPSLADHLACTGPIGEPLALDHAIATADLLHLAHGLGIVHRALSSRCLYPAGAGVLLGGFDAAARVGTDGAAALATAADVRALAATVHEMLTGHPWHRDAVLPAEVSAELAQVLHRALHRDAHQRFPTAIAFAQALCGVRDTLLAGAGEVTARGDERDVADAPLQELPLSDGAARSLRVLHAMLDRAEIADLPPDPGDPLVQRCWTRADAQVPARDARLVALRCRWRLLAERDPVGALSVSLAAAQARQVLPYRARALAALGRAAEARTLAVRSWFDDMALDLPALRSVMVALLLTRAFDMATLVSVAEGADDLADPVIAAARQVAVARGGRSFTPAAQGRAIRAIATALERGVPWTAELLVDPRWDALRTDVRFGALLARSKAAWTS
ncbi:MAG: hypothetical protein IT355_08515 [Gemmatimonadaceae bacterium]|nr:hypothetical protein [Gemmatimonadaceae bacterium]